MASLSRSKQDQPSNISFIVKRLEALELAQQGHVAAGVEGLAGGVGGTKSTAVLIGLQGGGVVTGSSAVPTCARGGAAGGIQAGAGAGLGDEPLVDPSLLPLTDALPQLALAVDPTAGMAKGLFMRPEYHFQHVKSSTPIKQLDYTKLDYTSFVYGWFCVIEHLIAKGGDLTGYIGHCKFVADQATSGSFVDAAYVNYDHHVVGKVVDGLSTSFTAGDMLGVASHFNASNLVIHKASSPKSAGKPGKARFWNKQSQQGSEQKGKPESSLMPDGFPDDICYSYNYHSCSGKCSKKHICRMCKGDHQAKQCTKRE